MRVGGSLKNNYFSTIEEFKETQPARVLMVSALKEIMPSKGNLFGFVLSIVLALLFSIIIGKSNDTVILAKEVASTLINIQLAIFGCVFAVYSILLAFLSDGYMKRLSKIKGSNKTSMLKQSTTYYESVLFLYFINIGFTGMILLLCSCLNPYFRLTSSVEFDTIFAMLLLMIYFGFSFRVFYELKSTIYNTIVLFRASISYKFIDFVYEDSNNEKEEDEKEKIFNDGK